MTQNIDDTTYGIIRKAIAEAGAKIVPKVGMEGFLLAQMIYCIESAWLTAGNAESRESVVKWLMNAASETIEKCREVYNDEACKEVHARLKEFSERNDKQQKE